MQASKSCPVLVSSILLVGFGVVSGFAEVSVRTANNGMVVLQGIPEVPQHIVDQLIRYQNVRGASFKAWSEDGKSMYVTTRFGNTIQLHHVARPAGSRRQITFYTEPIADAKARPETGDLQLRMDEGGGEFYQLFLLDPVSGERRRLTDGTSRNGASAWSPDGSLMAYQSTRRNGRSNDIWVMDPEDPEATRMVLESPDGTWWGPTDWSPDGSQILVANYVSITDSRIHILDADSGERTQVAGGEGALGVNLGVSFDTSGDGIYLLTDRDSEFSRLAYLDLTSGETTIITTDIDWSVGGFELSEDGSKAAFYVNEDGLDRLFLMDTATNAFTPVEIIPTGLIRALEFSPNGRRLALTLNGATFPSDVFTLEFGDDPLVATGLTRWTESEVGGLNTDSFIAPELIHYTSFDGRQIPAFIYKPLGSGPFPVVVSIHGGPEGQYRPRFSSAYQMWLAELRVAVIAPNVRGSSGYGKEYVKLDNGFSREDSVKDIGALLDWIQSQPDLNADQVAVYGGSYGGYMVLASLMHFSDRLVAGVDFVGISNFVSFLENTQDYRRDLRRVEYGDERDPKMRDFLEKISPSNHPDLLTTPLLVVQGENDPRVPVTEARQIVQAVRAAGYEVWYMNALNEGHGYRKKENRDLYSQVVTMFLRRHLLSGVDSAEN